ncbi:hypothetical protein Sjap_023547 [Stephania japonica]|uniref:BAT2 N-terminal domain-containing protein n=1 Tax=Stephania japonica TaxID=461633 RepID=A0AAP0EBT6_9MAGN
MASSVLPGERRWGSARRGGMTVLGKVAVPKPVNLPSQRLENHGLDPNVEIVPKGTLSWGSRSSSSAQNAWGSSSLSSPNTDGGTGSPSRLNDRPSSGGSGTRPSTAGSEKPHETVPNIWGSNSRPSSASGVLASNKTLTSASRPRAQKPSLGAPYGKNDGFTLSSGDFPTLGSEKPTELEGRNGHRSQERPVSASEDESSVDATRNDWRNDNSPFAGTPPRTDKWWMDAQTYPDPMMNSQQFGPWHGPVHNAPDGVWYRGPPGGPPFRPPGPPGSYPVEPFPYYHPRLPAQPPANMQPIPRAVSGPSGYHANNGNSYRPHGPDPYMQPVMPVRPGAYAVPVPYEGYYGPPRVGFCNPNDRDPIMGMGTGPGAYNRFPVQSAHPETGNIQARQGGYDSASMVMSKEQVEPGQPHGAHAGPYKVLLKQHDNWEENDGKEKRELGVNEQHRRAKLPGPPAREVELRVGGNIESVESSKLLAVEETSQSADARGEHSSGPVKSSLPESMNKDKAASDSLAKISEVAPVTGDAPQKNLSSTKKIPTLIEKIEGLNNKVRNSDGRSDAGHISIKDEKLKPSATVNARTDNVTKVALVEKKIEASVPLSTRELQAPAVSVSNSSESRDGSHSYSQRRPQGVQSRTEHYGKTKHNHLEGDQWRKKPVVADAPVVSSSKNVELSSHKPALECLSTEMTSGESDINIQGKSVGESNAKSAFDSSDHKAQQRVKMREIAAQRARQLQKEEEERTREQKAKALAKLEELNRRTLTEASTVRVDDSVSSSKVVQNKQEEILDNAGPPPLLGSSGTSASLNCNVNSVGQTSDKNIDKLGDVATLPKEGPPQEALPHSTEEIMVKHNLHLPSTSEISKDGSEQKIAASHDSGAVKQKQTGNKRKQTIDKNLFEGSISFGSFGDHKDHGIVITSSGECHWPSNVSGTDNQSVQHKKKNNRNSKNKQKVDTQSTMHMEEIPVKASDEGSNLKNSNSLSDASTVQELNSNGTAEGQSSQVVVPVTDQGLSTHTQEANSKSKHQPKPLPARWMSKNAQTNRMDKQHNGDNVVWAPVRSPLNKTEASEEQLSVVPPLKLIFH